MISHFEMHKADYKNMVEMLKTDKEIEYLWPDSMTPAGVINDQRWDTYRNIMKRLGVRGVYVFRTENSSFNFFNDLALFDCLEQGYFFSSLEPTPLKTTLNIDIDQKDIFLYEIYYRSIGDNWYIYLENLCD